MTLEESSRTGWLLMKKSMIEALMLGLRVAQAAVSDYNKKAP